MEKKKYHTPLYDSVLESAGWLKFENNPVYFKKHNTGFKISFNTDFKNFQLFYEKINKREAIIKAFPASMHVIVITDTNCLDYKHLLLLTADFYAHNKDKKLHEYYKNQYEKLSNLKY